MNGFAFSLILSLSPDIGLINRGIKLLVTDPAEIANFAAPINIAAFYTGAAFAWSEWLIRAGRLTGISDKSSRDQRELFRVVTAMVEVAAR
jgi:hypothetical protein